MVLRTVAPARGAGLAGSIDRNPPRQPGAGDPERVHRGPARQRAVAPDQRAGRAAARRRRSTSRSAAIISPDRGFDLNHWDKTPRSIHIRRKQIGLHTTPAKEYQREARRSSIPSFFISHRFCRQEPTRPMDRPGTERSLWRPVRQPCASRQIRTVRKRPPSRNHRRTGPRNRTRHGRPRSSQKGGIGWPRPFPTPHSVQRNGSKPC